MVPRLVPAPEGSCWWGIDPSTQRASIAWVRPDGDRGVFTVSFRSDLRHGARLWHIYAEAFKAMRHVQGIAPAGVVLIEQPFAKHVPPVSYLAMGALMVAAVRVTSALVEPVPVPTWKLLAIGRGSARKPQIMEWARDGGYEGDLQDEADGLGIAVAASKMFVFR